MAAQYVQGKLHFGGMFSNYMLNMNAANQLGVPGVYLGANLNGLVAHSAGMGPIPVSRYSSSDSDDSLDFRRSSIDKLRMKAKEHSTTSSPEPDVVKS